MFRTGRVCLCVVVGRCGGDVFLESVRGFCCGWGYRMCKMGGKSLIRRVNVLGGLKVLLSASAGVG